MAALELAATIMRRNGAYLIELEDPWDYGTPLDLITAASSMKTARRVAREGADMGGFRGPWRWEPEGGLLRLYATHAPESDEDGHDGMDWTSNVEVD